MSVKDCAIESDKEDNVTVLAVSQPCSLGWNNGWQCFGMNGEQQCEVWTLDRRLAWASRNTTYTETWCLIWTLNFSTILYNIDPQL